MCTYIYTYIFFDKFKTIKRTIRNNSTLLQWKNEMANQTLHDYDINSFLFSFINIVRKFFIQVGMLIA